MSRVWRYRPDSLTNDGWRSWLPLLGGDEYGRRTLAVRLPWVGMVVLVLYTCHCEECDDARRQTAEWEAEEAAEVQGE